MPLNKLVGQYHLNNVFVLINTLPFFNYFITEIHNIFFFTGGSMFQYYIKIVPTMYVKLDNSVIHTNQFSVTRHQKSLSSRIGEPGIPGAFFRYELSPLMVKYTEQERYNKIYII